MWCNTINLTSRFSRHDRFSKSVRGRHERRKKFSGQAAAGVRIERTAWVCLLAFLALVASGSAFSQANSTPLCPTSDYRFAAPGLVDLREGTIEFWVSLVLHESSSEYAADLSFFGYRAPNGDELLVRQASTGVVCAQAVIGGVYISAYRDDASVREWKAGSWHHVAFVFSERQNFMRMYVDGQAMGDTNEGLYRAPAEGAMRFTLGNPMYAMDSVRFTRETFDPGRVASEAARPAQPSASEVIFPLAGLSAGDQITIAAGAARGSLVYLGPPLANAEPDSALLPAGSTSVHLRRRSWYKDLR